MEHEKMGLRAKVDVCFLLVESHVVIFLSCSRKRNVAMV